jgi:hydrogenase maturation protease
VAARIIGVGQAAAGDDGVGIAVVRRLREMKLPRHIELVEAAEPSAMVPYLIEGQDRVVLIDAIVGAGPPGRVMRLESETSQLKKGRLLSSHGVGVLEAIELARELAPRAPQVVVLAIAIERPSRYGEGLTPEVAAAVQIAAEQALALAGGEA